MIDLRHLAWIPAGATAGFLASFVFGDLLPLPVDVYYLLYFTLVLGFLAFYAKATGLVLSAWISRRLWWGLALGLLGGLVLMRGVLLSPGTARPERLVFWWDMLWRGVVYGAVDGVLLLALPGLSEGASFARQWRRVRAEETL